ncbi:hypothetical protein ACFL2U_03375 [Patescibacteria group bacterium]
MKILKKILYFFILILITAIITGTLVFLWVRLDSLKDKYEIINYLNEFYEAQINQKDDQITTLEDEIEKLQEHNKPLWYLPGEGFNLKEKPVKYETTLKVNESDQNKTDIYVTNLATGEKILYLTLSNIYSEHYHAAEYHNDHLYIIKELQDPLTRQLWKYNKQKKGSLLYESEGIDFRVSPYENYVAILSKNRLLIMSKDGIIKSYNHFHVGVINESFTVPFQINLLKWSDDGKYFWGNVHESLETRSYYVVDSENWDVVKYETIDLLTQLAAGERALNPNISKLVYSNLPIFYDVDSAARFEQGENQVSLYVYDFLTQENKELAQNTSKGFKPIWLDDLTIEYFSTEENKNIRITIK